MLRVAHLFGEHTWLIPSENKGVTESCSPKPRIGEVWYEMVENRNHELRCISNITDKSRE